MKITRNKLFRYFLYVFWLEFWTTVFYAWWLVVFIHYTLQQLIDWVWQGLLLNICVGFAFAWIIAWGVIRINKRFPI